MKTKMLLLAIVAIFCNLAKSQTPLKATFINKFTTPWEDSWINGIVGNRTDGLCIVGGYDKRGNVYISKISPDNKIGSPQAFPEILKEKYGIHSNWLPDENPFIHLKDKYYYLRETYKKNGSIDTYCALEIDVKQGKILSPQKVLTKGVYPLGTDEIQFLVSSDNSKLWIVQPNPDSKKIQQRICVQYNENLKEEKSFICDFGLENKYMGIVNFVADGNNLYCLYRNMTQNHSKLQVAKINGTKPEVIGDFTLNDENASEQYKRTELQAKLLINKNQLIIAGYYYSEYGAGAGIFTCSLTNGSKTDIKYYPFTSELTTRYKEKCSEIHKKVTHVDDLTLKAVTIDSSTGDIYITGWAYTVSSKGWPNAGNIYTAKIKSDGTLLYSTKVPNNRITPNSINIYAMPLNGAQHIIYCDSKENTNSIAETDKKPAQLMMSSKGEDVQVVIDEKGEMKRYLTGLGSNATDAYSAPPIQISSNEFLFLANGGVMVIYSGK